MTCSYDTKYIVVDYVLLRCISREFRSVLYIQNSVKGFTRGIRQCIGQWGAEGSASGLSRQDLVGLGGSTSMRTNSLEEERSLPSCQLDL